MSTLSLCATPYNTEKPFWYFSSYEEYQEKSEKMDCEEFEIQFINGSEIEQVIFDALKVGQSNLESYFETIEELQDISENELLALKWLANNYSFDYALDHYKDVIVFEGNKENYAWEFANDHYDLEKLMGSLSGYFDYERFAIDLELGGDIVEIGYNLYITNPQDF